MISFSELPRTILAQPVPAMSKQARATTRAMNLAVGIVIKFFYLDHNFISTTELPERHGGTRDFAMFNGAKARRETVGPGFIPRTNPPDSAASNPDRAHLCTLF